MPGPAIVLTVGGDIKTLAAALPAQFFPASWAVWLSTSPADVKNRNLDNKLDLLPAWGLGLAIGAVAGVVPSLAQGPRDYCGLP